MLQVLLVINAALHWLDAATTLWHIGDGATEGNPIMAGVMAEHGVGAFMILKLTLALAILALIPLVRRLPTSMHRVATQVAIASAALMSLVVIVNATGGLVV